VKLDEGEYLIARRMADQIFVTNNRVISGEQEWDLKDVIWIHGSKNFACQSRELFPEERTSYDLSMSIWIFVCIFFISWLLAILWFFIWTTNKISKIGPMWTYQLAMKVGDDKVLVMEDVRRQEVKRLGLAISYAWRLKKRELNIAKALNPNPHPRP